MNEDTALLALHLVPNLGPVRIRRLLAEFGSARETLEAPPAALRKLHGFSTNLNESLRASVREGAAERELELLTDAGGWLLTHNDARYPRALAQLQNAPVLLEVLGTLTDADRHAIAIVGSRHCTYYGQECAKRFGYRLAEAGLSVVSGLARGIDTAAHQGAIAARGRTLAVIGSGLGQLYPRENEALAQRIARQGAVLSEFPFLAPPNPQTFPYRNRIVAGWCTNLLVVEAGERSGALITAHLAIDQGRQVYAIPGQIDRDSSLGTNRLIQQGAKLVTCAEEILEDLEELFHSPPAQHNGGIPPALPLPEEETLLLEALASGERSVEDLVDRTGLSAGQVSASLLSLELKKRVRPLPGRWFART